MRKILAILFVALSTQSFTQAPEGISYQAIIRDNAGTVLADQAVGLHVALLQGSTTGPPIYEEIFSETTNQFGMVQFVIGEGTVSTGDFSETDWSAGPFFVEISVDASGGTSYTSLGTQQLMSVPFSLYAKSAEHVTNDQVEDADADPTNELQSWSTLPDIPADLTDGDDVEDADADPTNELQSWSTLPDIPTDLTDGDDVEDADADPTNELQSWSTLPDIPADLTDGDDVEDADADPTNELQSWSTLPDIPTDLTDGDDVEDSDADPTNEIELPVTANEGDVLVYTGGQWQPGAPGSTAFQYSTNALYPSNTVRNTWVDYPGVSITVNETGTYYLQFYGFGQNTTGYNSNSTTTPDGDMHMRVQNTTTDQTIADVAATSQYLDVSVGSTIWRYINQYPSGWRVVDLNAGDVLIMQYIQYTFDDTLDGLWQMGPSGISIRKIN